MSPASRWQLAASASLTLALAMNIIQPWLHRLTVLTAASESVTVKAAGTESESLWDAGRPWRLAESELVAWSLND